MLCRAEYVAGIVLGRCGASVIRRLATCLLLAQHADDLFLRKPRLPHRLRLLLGRILLKTIEKSGAQVSRADAAPRGWPGRARP